MGVELRHIVQKKYHIIRVCEKSARGSAMPRREGWGKKNCTTGTLTMFYVSYNIIRAIKYGGEDGRI
jgi:hypothetical protein